MTVEGMRGAGGGRYSKCLACISAFDSDIAHTEAGSLSFSFPVLQRRKQRLGDIDLPKVPGQKVVELVSNSCCLPWKLLS